MTATVEDIEKLISTDEDVFEQFVSHWMMLYPDEVFNMVYDSISESARVTGSHTNEMWKKFLKAEAQKKYNFLKKIERMSK